MLLRSSPAVFMAWVLLLTLPPASAQSKNLSASATLSTLSRTWAPPNIDQVTRVVSSDVPCPLSEILEGTMLRAKELVSNLQAFGATEQLEHVEFGKNGKPNSSATALYSYVAEIREMPSGLLSVEEYRNGSIAVDVFPGQLATRGTAALALIFHPAFVNDYDMHCEGLATMNGKSAWQLHFAQRPDRPGRFRGYWIAKGWFPVKLKGRAWIATDTYNPLRIETDLLEPINAIPLKTEHLAIDYQSVEFLKRHVDLWLPYQVEIYMDFRGHRYYRRHSFSNFQLFCVDVSQRDHLPGDPL